MGKSLFEQMGGTYKQVGDYLLPDIELPDEPEVEISVWGQRRLRYMKEYRKATYYTLLTSGKLNKHLSEIDKQAEDMFFRLVEQYAAAEGITEALKAAAPMEWVGRMNNIRIRVTEIVNTEIIYK